MIKRSFIFSLLALLTAANASYAGCVQTFGVGSAAKGQAEAFAAKADDYSACYYNPAGLTQIESPTLSGSFNLYDAEGKIKNFEINTTKAPFAGANLAKNYNLPTRMHSTGEPLVTPTAGFVMPINNSWSFGVAGYSPYGLRVLWDHNPHKNSTALYAWESTYYRTVINPSAAYKVNENLSLGFGVSLGHSVSNAGRAVPTGINPVTKEITYADLKLETSDDFNYSFNIGVLYKASDDLSMGLTYRSITHTEFEGDVYMAGNKLSDIEMKYDHPDSTQAGIRYKVLDNLAIETDIIWTRWNVNRNQDETLSNPTSDYAKAFLMKMSQGTMVFKHDRSWNNTIQYKIGAEYQLNKDIMLRAGYGYDPTPVPTDTFDIGWPDTDRSMYTIGLGWIMSDKWSLDTALQYIRSTPMRSVSGSSELNHTYGKIVESMTQGLIPESTVDTKLKMEGLMVAYSLTMNYKF